MKRMSPEAKRLWVEALRSGEYRQTKGGLRVGDSFCCLGVLCNIHAKLHPEIAAKQTDPSSYMNEDCVLPKAVMKWAGLKSANPKVEIRDTVYGQHAYELAEVNDVLGKRFTTIARLIEEQL